jgi:hypothetical protein
VDHSSAGAVLVFERSAGKLTRAAAALAMTIAGHHSGLPALITFVDERLKPPEKQARLKAAIAGGVPDHLRALPLPEPPDFLRAAAFRRWRRCAAMRVKPLPATSPPSAP